MKLKGSANPSTGLHHIPKVAGVELVRFRGFQAEWLLGSGAQTQLKFPCKLIFINLITPFSSKAQISFA